MIDVLREIEAERGVPIELLCAALEEALRDAYRAHEGTDVDVIASVDRESGAIAVVDRRRVVAKAATSVHEISLSDAPPGYEPGDFLDDPVDVAGLARIAARTVLATLNRRVVEAEREAVFAKYRALQGTIVRGLVQREVDGDVYVALEYDIEAVLPRDERVLGDAYAINDRIDAELLTVAKAPRGPVLVLSRRRWSFVRALFENPARIIAGARNPGFVTVLASTLPVEAYMIAPVLARLGGERVDVIRFSYDPAELVAQVLPTGREVFALAEHRLVIVEGDDVTPLQLDLARQLCPGWGVRVAAPGASDVVLEEHLASIVASDDDEIDPEVVRRLEEYARERDEAEDA